MYVCMYIYPGSGFICRSVSTFKISSIEEDIVMDMELKINIEIERYSLSLYSNVINLKLLLSLPRSSMTRQL